MKIVWQVLKSADEYRHEDEAITVGREKWNELFRSKVPGGWLIKHVNHASETITSSIAFVPDPEHLWDGSSLP